MEVQLSDKPYMEEEEANAEVIVKRQRKEGEEAHLDQPFPATVPLLHNIEMESLWLKMVRQFREVLSTIDRGPPIDDVIEGGWVPVFVKFLSRNDFPELQFEAAWLLATIVSGTSNHTKVVVDNGAVPIFIKLLDSPSDHIREQAVWALGNIAGDSSRFRDFLLEQGALSPLLAQLNEHATLSMLRNVALTLLNFCRGNPQPPFEKLSDALPALKRLAYFDDLDVLTCACWSLSYLSDGTDVSVEAIIESGVCPRLVELISHPSPHVLIPALRILKNIARGDDSQRQFLIDHRVLPRLPMLLMNGDNKTIKREACRTISHITAGNEKQNKAVIDAKLITPLIHLLKTAESDVKEAAVRTVKDVISGGSRGEEKLSGLECFITPLCGLLESDEPVIVCVCLDALETIYKPTEEEEKNPPGFFNYYVRMIDECEGLAKINKLRNHVNLEVREKASNIWEPLYKEAVQGWKFSEEMADLFF